jgi:hypothetical protein
MFDYEKFCYLGERSLFFPLVNKLSYSVISEAHPQDSTDLHTGHDGSIQSGIRNSISFKFYFVIRTTQSTANLANERKK